MEMEATDPSVVRHDFEIPDLCEKLGLCVALGQARLHLSVTHLLRGLLKPARA
jgi:hypothetical protein